MKRILFVMLFLVILFTSTSMAHPPNKVSAEFDLETNILSVQVSHMVGGENSRHYIDEIIITHNGKQVIEQLTTRQLSNQQTFLYFMPAVDAGDEIKVVAVCNVAGQDSFQLTVKESE